MCPDTLTDYELEALCDTAAVNLADGHASQEMHEPLASEILSGLATSWLDARRLSAPEVEDRFRLAFSQLARSATMAGLSDYKICPTASNSADIIAAVLRQRHLRTRLIEPTFDNLALLLRRRGVVFEPLSESDLHQAVSKEQIVPFLDAHPCECLFLVQPNNPTGRSLPARDLRTVAEYCADRGMILVVDNSFRFFNREPVDDYSILVESNCSFMAFEDTGKTFPTNEQKASLIFCSPDLATEVAAVYNELFLRCSPFTLCLLTKILSRTFQCGLDATIWPQVDKRRSLVRLALERTVMEIDAASKYSKLSVEWMHTGASGMDDLGVTEALAEAGLSVLPGRKFYWHSGNLPACQMNFRMALMKPIEVVRRACGILGGASWKRYSSLYGRGN